MIAPTPVSAAVFARIAMLAMMPVLLVSACKPSEILAPDPNAQTAASVTFPAGKWADDAGFCWQIDTDGMTLSGVSTGRSPVPATLSAKPTANGLVYSISGAGDEFYGEGSAIAVDEGHAYFVTTGPYAAHGLFHFNHDDYGVCEPLGGAPDEPDGPRDIRPSPPNPTPQSTGDETDVTDTP